MIGKKSVLLLVILGFIALLGCKGPKVKGLVSVRGTIAYKGERLEGATVCFTPKEFKTGDRLGTGKTDAQGQFVLRTIGELGVLPGEYVVVVIKNEVVPRKQTLPVDPKTGRLVQVRPPPSEVRSLIPKRYGNAKTSDLRATVGNKVIQELHLEIVD